MRITHIQASLSYAVQYQRQNHAYIPYTGFFILRRSVPATVSCVYPICRPLYLTPFSTSDSIMRISHMQASLSYAVQYQRQYHAYNPYRPLYLTPFSTNDSIMRISRRQASLSYAVQYQRQYHAYNPYTGLFILRRSVPATVSCVYPIYRPLYLTPFSTSDSIMRITHIQASLSYAIQYQRQYHAYNPHTGHFILRRSVPATVSCVYPVYKPLYLTLFSTSDSIMRISHNIYTGLFILRRSVPATVSCVYPICRPLYLTPSSTSVSIMRITHTSPVA